MPHPSLSRRFARHIGHPATILTLVGVLLGFAGAPVRAGQTLSYTAADSETQELLNDHGENYAQVDFTIDGGSGSASLVTGTPQTLTIGSSYLYENSDGYATVSGTGLTITRQFTIGGITLPLTQTDDLSAGSGDGFDAIVDVHAGPTVTFDLGTTGQVDVTPQEYKYDLEADPTPPGYRYTLLLRAPAAPPVSVAVSPGAVTYPASAQGTVTLSHPAPAGGEDVTLSSSDPSVAVPALLHVVTGATSVAFPISTSRVDVNTAVTLTATAEQTSVQTTFMVLTRPETIIPYAFADLPAVDYTDPSGAALDFSITGGTGSVGLVPGFPYTINIGSYNLDLDYDYNESLNVMDVPISRNITLGESTRSLDQIIEYFTASTDSDYDVSYNADISDPDPDPLVYNLGSKGIVTVSLPGLNESFPPPNTPIPVTFTLMPSYPVVLALAVNPYRLYGGTTTYGRVRLDAHAPTGGVVVTLTSSQPDVASVPPTVTVPAGALSATFPVTTYVQDTTVTASITAQSGGYSAKTHIDVLAPYTISGTITDQSGAPVPGVKVTAHTTGTFILTSAATPHAAIPDGNASGLISTISPHGSGVINGISIGLDITHPKIGDLLITLTGPDGTSVVLQNPSNSSQQNLTASYPILTTPVQRLTAFIDKPVQGTWSLKVVDTKTGNAGTLNGWSLTFNFGGPLSSSTTTAPDGTYKITGLKEDVYFYGEGIEYYAVTPTLPGYSFAPASQVVQVGPKATPPNPDGIDFSAQ